MGPAEANQTIPEIPPPTHWKGGAAHVRLDREWMYPLMRRCANVVLLKIILRIVDQTTSWPNGPEFAEVDMDEWLAWTGASERSIEMQLAKAEEKGWIAREKPNQRHNRGGYKFLPENVKDTPLPAQRTRKCKPREVSVKGPMPVAALRVTPGAQSIAPQPVLSDNPCLEQAIPVRTDTSGSDVATSSDAVYGVQGPSALIPGAQLIALQGTPAPAQPDADDAQFVTLRVPRSALHAETGCAPGQCLLIKHLAVEASKQPACSFPDDEGQKLQFWISRQPWGFVSSLERRGLAPADLTPVLDELRASGYTPAEFVEAMRVRNIGISRDRENVVGLLKTLIRALPRKPIRPPNPRPTAMTRASDIQLP